MSLDNSFTIIGGIIEQNNLDLACFFHWESQHAITLLSGERNQAEWILESQPRVWAFQILEVVYVNFLFENDDNPIFSELDI